MQPNGRVDITDEMNINTFGLYDKIPVANKMSSYNEALTGNWSSSPLSEAFFSFSRLLILSATISVKDSKSVE